MRTAMLTLAAGSIAAGLAALPAAGAHAAPVVIAQASLPVAVVQPVWYDRWGRWHPPYYRYGYGPPAYAYGPHRYWRHRRVRCLRYGWC